MATAEPTSRRFACAFAFLGMVRGSYYVLPKFISRFRQLERQSIGLKSWKSKLEDSGRTLAKLTREGFRITTVVEFLDDKFVVPFLFYSHSSRHISISSSFASPFLSPLWSFTASIVQEVARPVDRRSRGTILSTRHQPETHTGDLA